MTRAVEIPEWRVARAFTKMDRLDAVLMQCSLEELPELLGRVETIKKLRAYQGGPAPKRKRKANGAQESGAGHLGDWLPGGGQ